MNEGRSINTNSSYGISITPLLQLFYSLWRENIIRINNTDQPTPLRIIPLSLCTRDSDPNISLRTISTMMLSLGMYPTKLSLVLFRSFVPLHQREKKYERKIHDTSKNFRNSHKGVDSILPLISQCYSYLNILLFSKYMIFTREIIFLLSKKSSKLRMIPQSLHSNQTFFNFFQYTITPNIF